MNEPTTPTQQPTPPASTPTAPPAAPQNPPAPAPTPAPETITVSTAEWRKMQGTLGQLQDAQRQREAEDKRKADELALQRGEHEKVIAQLRGEVETGNSFRERYQRELQTQWDEHATAIPKNDKRFDGLFATPQDGKPLSVEQLEGNLTELRKLRRLGILDAAPTKPREQTPSPTPPGGEGTPKYETMSDADFRKYRLQKGYAA